MKKHSIEFKSKVALDAIKGNETLPELSKRYALHPRQIQTWKAEAIKNFAALFNNKKKKDTSDLDKITELEKKVGQLVMENDFLKKSLLKLPGSKN